MTNDTAMGGESPLQLFLEDVRQAHDQTRLELRELDLLIRQSTAEVERLMQRNAQATNAVRLMHTSFDTIPRADIKESYEALISAQQRLFTMRGQLEKLQSDQRNLTRLAEFQQQLLELSGTLATLPAQPKATHKPADLVQVIRTEEAARQSLVRKMHDGPASSLSNFILQVEICQRLFDLSPERARAELDTLKEAVAATFTTVKEFIFDLRPMMLDDLGVVPTLRRYVETMQEKAKIPISFTVTGTERRLEEYVEVTLFRAVQELLHNARAYGQASQIQVFLDLSPDTVTTAVEDNGVGFNVEESLARVDRHQVGLTMLRERTAMLGGQLYIQSSPGQGARIELTIPVEAEIL
ncbi:MAG: ATP-binding protein [Chloroflexota bacterium]